MTSEKKNESKFKRNTSMMFSRLTIVLYYFIFLFKKKINPSIKTVSRVLQQLNGRSTKSHIDKSIQYKQRLHQHSSKPGRHMSKKRFQHFGTRFVTRRIQNERRFQGEDNDSKQDQSGEHETLLHTDMIQAGCHFHIDNLLERSSTSISPMIDSSSNNQENKT